MCPEEVEFVGAEFGEVLKGVEEHGDILMIEFGFMSVCHGNFDEISVLMISILYYLGKNREGRGTFALLASWRCLS
jgi:hypothetical protein